MHPITIIRSLRLAAGLPMNHLALDAGIGLNALRRMETSETFDEIAGVGVGQFYRVAHALNVSVVAVLPRVGGAALQGVSKQRTVDHDHDHEQEATHKRHTEC